MKAFEWLTPFSKPDREIGVEMGGCTGSPGCAAAVHIRMTMPVGSWNEAHLNPDEVRWLIRRLQESLAMYDAQRAGTAEAAAPPSVQPASPHVERETPLGRIEQLGQDLARVVEDFDRTAAARTWWWDYARRISAILAGDESEWESYRTIDHGNDLERIRQLVAASAGLPAVPATPAGTAALEDLPDLREISVYLHDVQCAEPGCPETAITWKATKKVRELLYTIAEHRRRYHHRVAT